MAALTAKGVQSKHAAKKESADGNDYEYVMVFKLNNKHKESLVNSFCCSKRFLFPCCPDEKAGADPNNFLACVEHVPEEAWLVLKALIEAGLTVKPYFAHRKDRHLLFMLITCSHAVLNKFADDKDYQVELDPVEVERLLRLGNKTRHWKSRMIADGDGLNEWGPYDHIYAKWETNLQSLVGSPLSVYRGLSWEPVVPAVVAADTEGTEGTTDSSPTASKDSSPTASKDTTVIFKESSLHRLNLINMLIRTEQMKKGAGVQLDTLLHLKKVDAFFPIHNDKQASVLLGVCWKWNLPPWRLPLERLKEYFGQHIALWFCFMSHYSSFLVVPGVVGLGCQLVVWATGPNFSSPVLPPFGAFICLWSIVMLAYWRRAETKRAFMWGASDYEATESQRPEFEGIVIRSYVNGELTLHFPQDSQERRLRFSTTVISTLILMVLGAVSGIYVMKFVLTKPLGSSASTLASIVNTVQINVFNYIYSNVARLIVENENHRTETEFADSLVSKLFCFQFVNSFASFFYIAFIAAYLEPNPGTDPDFLGQCGYYNCMQPLAVNLGILFGSRITINNLTSLLTTLYASRSRIKSEEKGLEENEQLSPPEKEYARLSFNSLDEMMKLYADTTIQFGFAVLFVCALPVSCLCSLASNHATVKMHLWKMLRVSQRPVPHGAQDIGPWFGIISLLAMAGVLTNAGLICFTMDVLLSDSEAQRRADLAARDTFRAGFSPYARLWVFVCFTVALLLLQFFIHIVVPPESDEVTLQKKRQEFVREKLIDGQADDDWNEDASMADHIPEMNVVDPHPTFFQSGKLTSLFRTHDALGDYVTLGAQLSGKGDDVEKLKKFYQEGRIAENYEATMPTSLANVTRQMLESEEILSPKKKPSDPSATQTKTETSDTNDDNSVLLIHPEGRTLDTGMGYVVGARVEHEFSGERWFPGTIIRVNKASSSSEGSVVSGGTFDIEFDDKGIRKAVAEKKLRPLDQEKAYADSNYRLTPSTAEEFECQIFYRALRRSQAGLDFIMFNKMHGPDIKRLLDEQRIIAEIDVRLSATGTLVSDSTGFTSASTEEYMLQSQLLFADIFSMCSFSDSSRLRLTGGFDQLGTALKLFYCTRNAALERRRLKDRAIKELLKTRGCFSDSSFNVLDGLRELLTNSYLTESWRDKEDEVACYSSVVALSQNLTVVCALILTISIPQGLNKNGISDQSSAAEIAYLFCISVVSLTEGLAVLITTRNLIALNALEPENIKPYLSVAQSVLLLPIRLNFVAVVALIAALNCWTFHQNGVYLWLGFFLLVCVPCVYIFLFAAGSSIKYLFLVQPWRTRKFYADDADAVLGPHQFIHHVS